MHDACDATGMEYPVREHAFARDLGRRWRFDFAWCARMLALEVEGGVWIYGRHNRAKGYIADLEKYSTAAALGWRIIRLTPEQLEQGMLHNILRMEQQQLLQRAEHALRALEQAIARGTVAANTKQRDAIIAALETIVEMEKDHDQAD